VVVLVPTDPDANSELFRRDQSDSDGNFTLATVIPGEYSCGDRERLGPRLVKPG
jgi:protocatechuate 3,4-dioxygenase beta subunit